MWSNSCISSLIFFSTLVLSILHFSASQNLITNICEACSHQGGNFHVPYDFCMSSFLAVRGSHRLTLKTLGLVSIKLIKYNLTDTSNYIKDLLKEENLDQHARSALQYCLQDYSSNAFGRIKMAIPYCSDNQFSKAALLVRSVSDDAFDCEDKFHQQYKLGGVSPLALRNNVTVRLTSIAMHILSVLQGGTYTIKES